jgi:hypothetical protein
MNTSDQINELAAALAKAQGVMRPALKTGKNPRFGAFADMSDCWQACREPLAANGIAVLQSPETTAEGNVSVTTRLIHTSGQWAETTLSAQPAKHDAQSIGSTVTYLRRYTLAAMVGIVADDDDGESASRREPPKPTQDRSPSPKGHHPSWEDDRRRFCAWAGDQGTGYDGLRDWCVMKGWGKPSTWDQAGRDKMRGDVDGWLEEHLTWLGQRA